MVRFALYSVCCLVVIVGWHDESTPTRAQAVKALEKRGSRAPATKTAEAPALPKGIRLKETIRWPGAQALSCVTFSADGRTVAASGGTMVHFWGADADRLHGALKYHGDHSWFRNLFSIAYSPEGRSLAAGSWDGTITIWDLTNGKKRLTLAGHQHGDPTESAHPVFKIAYSPDGKLLASASWDDTARVWDPGTGQERHVLKHPGKVRTLAFSPDSEILATGMGFEPVENVILWDSRSGKELGRLAADRIGTVCTAFAPTGRLLATGGQDHQVRFWDVDSRVELAELSGHSEEVSSLAFSPDGQWLASAAGDYRVPNSGELLLREVQTGQTRLRLLGALVGNQQINSVAFSPDGRSIATSFGDGSAKVWDCHPSDLEPQPGPRTWIPRRGLLIERGLNIPSLAVSPDGKTLAVAAGRLVKLYDTASRAARATLRGHDAHVMQVVFSPDGKILASSASDAEVRLWNISSAKELRRLARPYVTTHPIAFTPDGQSVVVSWRDNSLKGWDVSTGSLSHMFEWHRIGPLVYSRDGRVLAMAGDGEQNGTVRLMGTLVALGGAQAALQDHGPNQPEPASGRTVPPGGGGGAGGLGAITIAETGGGTFTDLTIAADTTNPSGPEITCLAFAPDGQTLAAGEWNHGSPKHDVVLWNITSGEQKARLTGHTSVIRAVVFSPDGRWLATASGDRTGAAHMGEARIWDVQTNRESSSLTGHHGGVFTLAITPDGRTLITGGEDGVVRFWDVPAK
jgi:WD40 repeat protein